MSIVRRRLERRFHGIQGISVSHRLSMVITRTWRQGLPRTYYRRSRWPRPKSCSHDGTPQQVRRQGFAEARQVPSHPSCLGPLWHHWTHENLKKRWLLFRRSQVELLLEEIDNDEWTSHDFTNAWKIWEKLASFVSLETKRFQVFFPFTLPSWKVALAIFFSRVCCWSNYTRSCVPFASMFDFCVAEVLEKF